jgi:uncharacterized Ntn-hydrolase superfamily protein
MTPTLRHTLLAAAFLIVALPSSAAATWSIIVLDKGTGLIGVGGASCTSDVHGIMALAPGTGALVAQAIGNPAAMREAVRLLRAGVAPDSILRSISHPALDSAFQDRQYGIATFASGQVQFSGAALREYRGERSAEGVLVQGSLLAGPAVLDRTMAAIQQARTAGKPLEDVIMAGLKAGAEAGGDSRCGAQRATAAFLSIAKPGDNPNWPYLTLRVVDAARGSTVRAVDLLQTRLLLWKANRGPTLLVTSETIKPDSVR